MASDPPYGLGFLFSDITDVHFGNAWAGVFVDAGGGAIISSEIDLIGESGGTPGLSLVPNSFPGWSAATRVTAADLKKKLRTGAGLGLTAFGYSHIADTHIPEVNCNGGSITTSGSNAGVACFFQPSSSQKFKITVRVTASGAAFTVVIGAIAFKPSDFKAGIDAVGGKVWPAGLFAPTNSGTQTFIIDPQKGTAVEA